MMLSIKKRRGLWVGYFPQKKPVGYPPAVRLLSCQQRHLATFSSHLIIASMVNMDMRHTKTIQVADMEKEV